MSEIKESVIIVGIQRIVILPCTPSKKNQACSVVSHTQQSILILFFFFRPSPPLPPAFLLLGGGEKRKRKKEINEDLTRPVWETTMWGLQQLLKLLSSLLSSACSMYVNVGSGGAAVSDRSG